MKSPEVPGIRTLEERLIYENGWVRVYDDAVQFPDGSTGAYYYSRWKAPHGVAVVPVLGDRVLLLRNYRYGEKAWSTEIPQGFGVEGATPEADARRELLEETGLEALSLTPLMTLGVSYATHVFVAEIDPAATPHQGGAEHSESIADFVFIRAVDISPSALAALGVFESGTLAALLAYRQSLS